MIQEASPGATPRAAEDGTIPSASVRQSRTAHRHGIGWVAGSFLFCPCHLPVTLGLLAFLLGGTTAGALLRQNLLVAGAVITIVWALGTWRGVRHLRAARTCAVKPARS